MKPLPDIDTNLINGKSQERFNGEIPDLLHRIKWSENPLQIKNAVLSIMQLYYDGLISLERRKRHWPIQQQTLERLLEAGRECIGNFYGGQLGEVEDVREKILPIARKIKRYSSPVTSKGSHLDGNEKDVYNFGLQLPNFLEDIDVIVPVASEGFEPACLLSDIYENSSLFPIRLSRLKEKDDIIRLAGYLGEEDIQQQINQKNVLVVEGTVSSGYSMYKVADFVMKRNPSRLYAACVRGIPANKRHNLNIAVTLLASKFVSKGNGFFGEIKEELDIS